MGSNVDGLGKLSATEDLDTILGGNQTILFQDLDVEVRDILGLGESVEGIDIYAHVLNAVEVLESEFRDTAIERHLTALESHLLVITRLLVRFLQRR